MMNLWFEVEIFEIMRFQVSKNVFSDFKSNHGFKRNRTNPNLKRGLVSGTFRMNLTWETDRSGLVELFPSTISVVDLVRKHSSGWDKEYPKCTFSRIPSPPKPWGSGLLQSSDTTSQIIDSGKHKCETVAWRMETKKDDSPLKVRFLVVRKEIYNHYTEKEQTEQQKVSETLKRGMSERERESSVIEMDTDITGPGSRKETNRTVTDRLIKKPSHEKGLCDGPKPWTPSGCLF
jgi:hypothetical protein